MKKYFAFMVAFLFLFAIAGPGLAQTGKQDAPAKPIEGKKTEKSEKRQAVTPDKKKAAEAPKAGEGQAASDTKPVKKSEKSKKRQAQTPEKKKASESPKEKAGEPAKP